MRSAFVIGIGLVVAMVAVVQIERQVFRKPISVHQTAISDAELSQVLSPDALSQRWHVTAHEAVHLLSTGATLIDARGSGNPLAKKLQGSVSAQWQDFSQSKAMHRGKLITDISVLESNLRRLGISNDVPVVVYGDPLQGWGEEGRIVWMLRVLGHEQAVWVDGGVQALIDAGAQSSIGITATVANHPGDFTAQLGDRWQVNQDHLKQRLNDGRTILIDTREEREYQGQTPYGETRGGHIPGAVHLYFKEFLSEDGLLLPRDELESMLAVHGISSETPIVAYCTGGVRSAWVTAVLVDLGFSAENYAGSTWEWAASPKDTYPLISAP
ncbi:MAG: rhodanese-like domain-containing protein [Cyanobacteria bacterium P01_A01_bin.37]